MKIIPHETVKTTESQKGATKPATGGSEFRDILKQVSDATSHSVKDAALSLPVHEASMVPFETISHISAGHTIDRVEDFLQIIEAYQRHMEDPGSTLRDCYPLVSGMERATSGIMPLLDSLSDGDGLKDILNRAVVTATVEAIKFNRGDYL